MKRQGPRREGKGRKIPRGKKKGGKKGHEFHTPSHWVLSRGLKPNTACKKGRKVFLWDQKMSHGKEAWGENWENFGLAKGGSAHGGRGENGLQRKNSKDNKTTIRTPGGRD